MGRPKELKEEGKAISIYLEAEDKEELKKIACRDTGGNMSKLARRMVEDYIKAHKAGNTTYSLDDFGKHKDMIAIPALMSNREDLSKYIKEEYDYAELQKVKDQTEWFLDVLRTKLLNTPKDEEEKRIADARAERFRRQNDIRYKDPKKMTWNQQIRYNQIMNAVKENQNQES
jgi:hypothetical protein